MNEYIFLRFQKKAGMEYKQFCNQFGIANFSIVLIELMICFWS